MNTVPSLADSPCFLPLARLNTQAARPNGLILSGDRGRPRRCVVEALFGYGNSFLCQRYKLPKQSTKSKSKSSSTGTKRTVCSTRDPLQRAFRFLSGPNHVRRQDLPMKGREVVAHKWTAALDKKRNLALTCVNEGLYSSDCTENQMRLTLLRSPAYSCHPLGKPDCSAGRPLYPPHRSGTAHLPPLAQCRKNRRENAIHRPRSSRP